MRNDPELQDLFDSFPELRDGNGLLIANEGLPLYVRQAFVEPLAAAFPAERVLPLESAACPEDRGIVFETSREDFVHSEPPAACISFFRDHYPAIVTRRFDPAPRRASPEEVDLSEGLILFHTPRTGSHYLQSIIAAVDGFGPTEEWIRPPIVLACQLGITELYTHLQNCIALLLPYVRQWSLTIECRALQQQWKRLSEQDRRRILALMSRAHRFILTRQDRVAQAWSDVKAISTGVFFETVEDQGKHATTAIADWDHHWFWVGLLIRQNIGAETWLSGMLAEHGLPTPIVAYEDILTDDGLHQNAGAILGPLAGSAQAELKTSSTRFRRQLTYQDVGTIVQLGNCLDGEKSLYPASPCHLALLGDAVMGRAKICIHAPFGGIIVRPRLLAGGTLRIDFALVDGAANGQPMISAPVISAQMNGEQILEFPVAGAGPHTLHMDVAPDVSQPVVVLFLSTEPDARPFCTVHRVSLIPVPFEKAQLFPWSMEVIAMPGLRILRYDE